MAETLKIYLSNYAQNDQSRPSLKLLTIFGSKSTLNHAANDISISGEANRTTLY